MCIYIINDHTLEYNCLVKRVFFEVNLRTFMFFNVWPWAQYNQKILHTLVQMYKMQLYLGLKVFGVRCDLGWIYKQFFSLCVF
jgi:hypothetical protein